MVKMVAGILKANTQSRFHLGGTLASRFHEFNRTNGTRCAPSPLTPPFSPFHVRNPNTFFQPRLPFSGYEARPVIRFAHISSPPAMVETDGKKNRTRTLHPVRLESFHRNDRPHPFSTSAEDSRPESKSRDLYLTVSWSKFFLILDSLKLD